MLKGTLKEVESLQIRYSPDADVLIISFREGKPVDSVDIAEGIIAHYSKDNKILELEILDATNVVDKMSRSLKGIESVKVYKI